MGLPASPRLEPDKREVVIRWARPKWPGRAKPSVFWRPHTQPSFYIPWDTVARRMPELVGPFKGDPGTSGW
jgi:hypothetical protein